MNRRDFLRGVLATLPVAAFDMESVLERLIAATEIPSPLATVPRFSTVVGPAEIWNASVYFDEPHCDKVATIALIGGIDDVEESMPLMSCRVNVRSNWTWLAAPGQSIIVRAGQHVDLWSDNPNCIGVIGTDRYVALQGGVLLPRVADGA